MFCYFSERQEWGGDHGESECSGEWIERKSLSDGIIETGSCTQIIKAKGHQIADVKDDRNNYDTNKQQPAVS